ncbi:MAG: rod shape-determining protein RodA [Solirubrobacterales bacterium]
MRAAPQPFRDHEPRRLAAGVLQRIDWLLVLGAVGLMGCSLFVLAFVTRDDLGGDPAYFVVRQATYAGIGLLLMFGVARFDYSRLRELRVGVYAVMLISIASVLVLGFAARGSRRWIDIGFFQLQPSELGKLLLIVVLSAFVIDRSWRVSEAQRTARLLLIGLIPAGFVLIQPDLGTSMVYGVITATVLFVGGVRWTHFAALGALSTVAVIGVIVIAPALGTPVLHDYQTSRLTGFVSPSDDPAGQGYQINQSKIAIGSGRKTGRGDEATQSRFDFLPEGRTDFIFAAVGERYGFVGAALVLSLYALLIWRALRILTLSKNLYGALIAGGIVAMLMFQVFINVGMTLGLAPITGIPLPLMSYGGTSVLVTFLALGVLQSIYGQAQLAAKRREPAF